MITHRAFADAQHLGHGPVGLPVMDQRLNVMRFSRDNLAMSRPLPRVQDQHCNGVDAPGRYVNLGVALAQEWAVALHVGPNRRRVTFRGEDEAIIAAQHQRLPRPPQDAEAGDQRLLVRGLRSRRIVRLG